MAVEQQIQEKVRLLPENTQYEVLDFVEYLLHRSRQEDLLWTALSLRWALRDQVREEGPDYTADDLRETYA
jgi:hypothetical protein